MHPRAENPTARLAYRRCVKSSTCGWGGKGSQVLVSPNWSSGIAKSAAYLVRGGPIVMMRRFLATGVQANSP
jgi:hypothetical protein